MTLPQKVRLSVHALRLSHAILFLCFIIFDEGIGAHLFGEVMGVLRGWIFWRNLIMVLCVRLGWRCLLPLEAVGN